MSWIKAIVNATVKFVKNINKFHLKGGVKPSTRTLRNTLADKTSSVAKKFVSVTVPTKIINNLFKNVSGGVLKNEIKGEIIKHTLNIINPKEKGKVNFRYFSDKDGLKIYNNIIKSLNSSINDAIINGQDTTILTMFLNDFQKQAEKYGHAIVGNYVLFLLETGEIEQTVLSELFGSDSELVGNVLVDDIFWGAIVDDEKIKNFIDFVEDNDLLAL